MTEHTNHQSKTTDLPTTVRHTYNIADLARAIDDAPPPPKQPTTSEALLALKTHIRDAEKRGHTADSVHKVLQSNGLKVSKRLIVQLMRDRGSKLGTKERSPATKRRP